jgi:hypothetical protein
MHTYDVTQLHQPASWQVGHHFPAELYAYEIEHASVSCL